MKKDAIEGKLFFKRETMANLDAIPIQTNVGAAHQVAMNSAAPRECCG
jgi:hypothetical protein